MHNPNRPQRTTGTGRTPKDRPRAIALSVALVSVALLAAACGSSSPTTTANAAGSSPKGMAQAAFKFSECMRQHGVPNFPDPVVRSNSNGSESVGIRVDPGLASAPAMKAAQNACRAILPVPSAAQIAQQQHLREQHMLAFAECMRTHGISGFPDPTSQGQLSLSMLRQARIDVAAPAVQSAALTCVPASGGELTAAAVKAAASGAGQGTSSSGGG
jgi:hypothetical protein